MSTTELPESVRRNPLAHPAIASVRLFDYSYAPGDHLKEFYNVLWKAVDDDFEHAPKKIARLMPREHGKSEGACVVFPTWLILRYPSARVAIVSKTEDLASERTQQVVEYVRRYAPQFGVEVTNEADTELETASNTHKEPTISPYGMESQLTGKHFDVVIFDDIADWENQRTEAQRRNLRNQFRDYSDNLPSDDSVFEGGAVQAVIGTRKHPQDIYQTEIFDSATWDLGIYQAIDEADWSLVENRRWRIRGDDGEIYSSVADLPEGVNIANNGVLPDDKIRVLWREHKPPESLLYDIVDSDSSVAIWRRENQQDPEALSGEVFKSDWLVYVDELPRPETSYRWLAGMDLGLVEDAQKAAEDDSDYTALAVVAWNANAQKGYLVDLRRERGLSVKQAADWAERHLDEYDIDKLLVEQNANRGVAQRLRDDSDIQAEGTTSSGDKDERIHNLAADFEGARLKIVGDSNEERWRDFEQKEWLQFPNAAHDDRLDAIEITLRDATTGGRVKRTGSMTDLIG